MNEPSGVTSPLAEWNEVGHRSRRIMTNPYDAVLLDIDGTAR
jgi:hypothetical protein